MFKIRDKILLTFLSVVIIPIISTFFALHATKSLKKSNLDDFRQSTRNKFEQAVYFTRNKEKDMNKLLSDIANTFEFKIKQLGVILEIGKLPSCRGEETQINQVFSNLIDNAIKHLDPGRKGVIRISGQKAGERMEYCIEDNGVGIAAENQKMIYVIFQRLNPKETDGEGLGLAIVRNILERHGEKIHVESGPGIGSRFFVSLPT